MKGYWIVFGAEVTNPDAHKQYVALWSPIAEKYQAKVRALDADTVLKESHDTRRVVVVEFPSYEAAKACYDDPAYQHAKQVALQAAKRELIIVEGDFA